MLLGARTGAWGGKIGRLCATFYLEGVPGNTTLLDHAKAMSSSDPVTINWGDGHTDSVAGTTEDQTFPSHTYVYSGDYEISVYCDTLTSLGALYLMYYPMFCAEAKKNFPYLKSVVFADGGNFSFGDGALRSCSSLEEVTLSNSITDISRYAFYGCTGLTSIDIPSSVSTIGVSAFRGCSSLTSVDISSSVGTIGASAFYNCEGLTSITCRATTPPTISSTTFYGVTTGIPVYVPASSISAYQAASYWSSFTDFEPIAS